MNVRQRLGRVLPHGGLSRSIGIVALGTLLGQAISIAMTPVLTHLYSPADFGVLAVFVSALAILNTFDSCSYESAIPLPAEEESATDLVVLASCILVASTSICFMFVLHIGAHEFFGDGLHNLGALKFLLPVGMLGVGVYQILNLWTIRRKAFNTVSRAKVVQSVSLAVFQGGAGLSGLGAVGLVGGYLVAQFAGIGTMMRGSELRPMRSTMQGLRLAAVRYRKFPIFQMWATLAGAIGIQIPVFMFAKYFGIAQAGYYGLTMRMLGIPIVLFGQSVSQVFYPVLASKASEPSAVQDLTERTVLGLLLPSICIFGFTAINAPILFPLIFGGKWRESGIIAGILTPWFLLWFVSSPISSIMMVKQRQGTALGLNLVEMGLRIAAIWVGARCGSMHIALIALSGTGVLISGVFIAIALTLAGSSVKKLYLHHPTLCNRSTLIVLGLAVLASVGPRLPGALATGLSLIILLPFGVYAWTRVSRGALGVTHG